MAVQRKQDNIVDSKRILYTPSDFARTSLLHLQEIGQLQANKPHVSQRTDLSSFLFFIVLEGEGTLTYQDNTYALHEGDCVFINCKNKYSHSTGDHLWKLSWVHFYGPSMNTIYDKYKERGGLPIFHPSDILCYTNILQELYDIAVHDSYVKDMEITEKLSALLTNLMKDSWRPEQARKRSEKKQNLQNIREYLEEHYKENITLDQLASVFYVNKFYLTKMYKEQYGTTISTDLMQMRITCAKRLLRFTDTSIERIAEECGIKDANYFARVFRKVEGVSPKEYRKLW